MTEFSPEKDFLLPIGAFAERLLGDGISSDIREKAAQIQANLIVMEKYTVVPDEIPEGDRAKFKADALFKGIKDPELQLRDLQNMVPAEVDINEEIRLARALVDAGKGVPNVPAFGQILSRFIPKEAVNLCLQVQAGLRVLALDRAWEGCEKIPEARTFPSDPENLVMVQAVSNKARLHRQEGTVTGADAVGMHAIADAVTRLGELSFVRPALALAFYVGHTQTGLLKDAYEAFMNDAGGDRNDQKPPLPKP